MTTHKSTSLPSRDLPYLWNFSYDSINYTFIDFIKGFVHASLVSFLSSFQFQLRTINDIISEVHDRAYNSFMEKIWRPRCEIIHNIEKSKNINKKFKNLNRSYNPQKSSFILDRNINLANNLESLQNKILFGGDILDYYAAR